MRNSKLIDQMLTRVHTGLCYKGVPADATAGHLSVRSWLMIITDGINSRVRDEVYRTIRGSSRKVMARAQYSGIVSLKEKETYLNMPQNWRSGIKSISK